MIPFAQRTETRYTFQFFIGYFMAVSNKEIENVCRLAKLKIPETDDNPLHQDINDIMNFVDQLKSVDTAQIEPLFHPFQLQQSNREDVVTEVSCIKELESIAPLFEDGHYLVPKVIED